jgi:hypothetical protein
MKVSFVGHSHIQCVVRATRLQGKDYSASVGFVQLRDARFARGSGLWNRVLGKNFASFDQEKVEQAVAEATQGAALAILLPNGNEHVIASLLNRNDRDESVLFRRIREQIDEYQRWLIALVRYVRSPAAVLPPPPPIESDSYILENPGFYAEKLASKGVAPAKERLRAWLYQKQLMQDMAAQCHLHFLELPPEVFSEHGFRNERYLNPDPTHGNEAYGELILRRVIEVAADHDFVSKSPFGAKSGIGGVAGNKDGADVAAPPGARRHPYEELPDRAYWKQAVAQVPVDQIDPMGEIPFKISRTDKVATAGSCFAQHVSKRIRFIGLQFLVTETSTGNADGNAEARGVYDFSARYGNIYTARQLLQLFDRAFGYFSPVDSYWVLPDHRFCDPFRPRIEPDGFASIAALVEDRQRHLAAVRTMFEQLDVFVFTLGLTECWVSRLDGAAFPIAPGVAGGRFDPSKYEFANFGVNEVVSDLQSFIKKLRLVNRGARLILTVSPVPLVATYEPNHVLVSTTYSKSVLRVAADILSRSWDGVCYFPSFEIITGNYNRGRYFGPDLRSVTEDGVDHVMSVFVRHMTDGGEPAGAQDAEVATQESDTDREMAALAEAACDEELLERK